MGARYGVHVEVFAQDRVVIIAAGIGTREPLRFSEGRISKARCYGDLVTLEPTGLVLVRVNRRLTLGQLFRSWGQPLSPHLLASFVPARGKEVAVSIDGHAWRGPPADVPLRSHSEIVLEVGPPVPPHASYSFPPGT